MAIVARTRMSIALAAADNRKRRLGLPWLAKPICRRHGDSLIIALAAGDRRGKLIIVEMLDLGVK